MKQILSSRTLPLFCACALLAGLESLHAQLHVAGQLLIDLHASRGLLADGAGAVNAWTNYGSVGGVLTNDGAATTFPASALVGAQRGVSFDGGDRLRASFPAPADITGLDAASRPDDYTVEYWVLNPAIANEEWLCTFARRGTSPRFAGFGYGTSASFGFTAHWSTPDMAFGEGVGVAGAASTPSANAWHHLVVTYDGTTERGYVDGVLNAQEAKSLNIWDGDPVTLGQTYEASLAYSSSTIAFSGSLVALRVHAGALTATQVASNYALGIGAGGAWPAQIVTRPISNLGAGTATLNGELLATNAPSSVWFFYGTTDAQTNKAGWNASVPLGPTPLGPVSTAVSGLPPNTTYFYRAYASNVLGETWSLPLSFVSPGPPVVGNQAPKTVLPTSARLMGWLFATNLLPTQGRVYWGASDGGTVPASWANAVDLGLAGVGELAVPVSGLSPSTTYYYRFYAINDAGGVWAGSSQSFTTPPVFDSTGFNYQMPITFTGYTSNEILVNFPALVVLNSSIPGFDYAQVASGGNDLRFVWPDGGLLNHEIESWDPTGNSYVWVQVPDLTNGAALQMFWGKGGLPPPAYTLNGATWRDGFAGVWHMTNKFVKDSSPNGYHASAIVAPAAVSDTPGLVGPAQAYTAATGNGATSVGDIDLTNLTLSAWVWLQDPSREGTFMCKDGVLFFWQQGVNLRHEALPWGGDTVIPVASAGGVGTWIHLAGTVNGTTQAFYTNGVLAASWTKVAPSQNNNPFQLGGVSSGRIHNGKLDECRAERVGRSAAWIWACYANQSAPATFETFGPVTRVTSPLSLEAPLLTSVGTTTVDLQVWINSDGGNGVTSWGTFWDATPAPAAHLLAETGAAAAPFAFTQTRPEFAPGGHYYLRGFASNALEGIRYSADTEFYTEPEPATALVLSSTTNNSLTVSWTPGAGNSGTLVLVREGNPVSGVPSDGSVYAGHATFELGSHLGSGTYVVYAGPEAGVTVNGLLAGTTYHVAVYPYAGGGSLINYQQDAPLIGSQATPNNPGLAIAGQLLIDLSAGRGLQLDEAGALTNWINYGSVGGSFAADGIASTYPAYGTFAGQVAASFDGGDHLRARFPAPPEITGVNALSQPDDFSIEMWVLNPVIANEEWIFAWGRRGTSPRCAAIGYGTNNAFGVLGHWAAPDQAFGEGVGTPGTVSTPAANAWHHIVATYNGTTELVYVDGVLNATEAKALSIWDGGPCILGDQFNDLPFSYANLKYSGLLAALRVHSRALTAAQAANNFALGRPIAEGPATIVSPPRSRTVIEYGATRFAVSAIGAQPITYQWYRDDAAIPEATDRTLTVSDLSLADNGTRFTVVVANTENGNTYTATSAPAVLTVVRAADTLEHRYAFDGNAIDSVGTAHGQVRGGATFAGGSVVLDGVNGYVDLPNGMFTNNRNITLEAWLVDNTAGAWARIWDFGNASAGEDFPLGGSSSGTQYMFITPQAGGGNLRGAYTVTGGGAGEQIIEWPGTRLPRGVLKQVVWTTDETLQTGVLYVDGVPVATNPNMTLTPASFGVTSNNWIGRSQFGADAMLQASITEFRIYNQALPPCKVRQAFLQGPNLPLNNDPYTVVARPQDRTNNVGTVAVFSILVASCEPVFYQWFQDDVDLFNETNATLSIADVQPFNAGLYEVVVSDGIGTELLRASATLTVNYPPTAGDDLIGAGRDLPVTFPASQLVTNDVDPDLDPITVVAASPTSTSGGAVTLVAGQLTYAPPPGFTGTDSFTYTLSDGRGGTGTGTVNVTVVVVTHRLAVSLDTGVPAFTFSGIPYLTYRILVSEDLESWTELARVTAGAAGDIAFQDTTTPLPAKRFYKAVAP